MKVKVLYNVVRLAFIASGVFWALSIVEDVKGKMFRIATEYHARKRRSDYNETMRLVNGPRK
jgi:hypothetical protein